MEAAREYLHFKAHDLQYALCLPLPSLDSLSDLSLKVLSQTEGGEQEAGGKEHVVDQT